VAATFVAGVLAGGAIDRVIVGGPAWHELGADAWVQYSRRADLGSGVVVYPVEGIGAALLIIAATLSNYLDHKAPRRAALALYLAVAFSVIGLLLTVTAAHQDAFDAFFLWGLYLRGSVDALAFLASVWALSLLTAPEVTKSLDAPLVARERRNDGHSPLAARVRCVGSSDQRDTAPRAGG
jgi:hypothetical protein